MKLRLIMGTFIAIAILQCGNIDTPLVSHSDSTPPGKIVGSPEYKDGKYEDMGTALNLSFTEFASTTWEFLFAGNNRTPDTRLPVKQVNLSHFNKRGSDQLNVTWLGHSSLMINIDGYKILTDPVFEKRISIFGPTRFNGDVPLDIEQVPETNAVIISHDHYDHLNKLSVQGLMHKTDIFIVPLHVGALLHDWGVPREKIVELDWWQEYKLDQKLMIAATPALHFSGRGITDRNKTLWSSWVIQTAYHNLFFSGDSGYFVGFKQIGKKYGPFDMTFIECGAYGKSWPKVHMFPEQTVQAHLDLKGDILHPIHWGTFNLALHPWYEPMERLSLAAEHKNIKVATPIVGETTLYGRNIPVARWWEPVMELSRGVISRADINSIMKHE